MKRTVERELKLRADESFSLPDLGGNELESRVFVSTYHDTADYRLARVGITLRHRLEGGRGLWQLKLPHGDSRLELELAGPPAEPPDELMRLLPAVTRRLPLEPVARLRTRRGGVRVRDDGSELADVIFDSVAVMEGQRVTRTFEELEVELLDGDERALRRIERALRSAGAVEGDPRPKLFKALDLDPVLGEEPTSSDSSPPEVLQAMFRLQLWRALRHDPGTRLGGDPEDLHQLRVATRRLRAFLRAARPLLDRDWAQSMRAELAWLGSALGPVRDLDVLLEHLEEEARELEPAERDAFAGLLAQLGQERETARAAMIEALHSDRYLALLDRLEEAGERPPVVQSPVSLRSIWRREFRRLQKSVGGLGPEPDDEAIHATRIRAKRARYAAELAAPELGKPGWKFVSGAKRVQDLLGDHQDAAVAEERIRSLLRGSRRPAVQFAAGRLVERQRARRRAARTEFTDAWERLERLGKKA